MAEPGVRPHCQQATRGAGPATILLILASLLFAVMALLVKRVSSVLAGEQIAFVRFALGLVACAIAARISPFRPHNTWGLLLRGAFGGGAVVLYFVSIAHLPVGMATLLNNTAPVFTTIFAVSILGETVTAAMVTALCVAAAGVMLLVRAPDSVGACGFGLWHLVGLGSAALSGAAVATIREVRRTDGAWEIFGAFCAVGAIGSAVPALSVWKAPTGWLWAELFAIGLLSVAAQILMTYALRYVRAAAAGLIAQLNPVVVLALGWAFLNEPLRGTALAGAALATAGVTWGAYLEARPREVEAN